MTNKPDGKAADGQALHALQRDAARYRWLRERDLDTINSGGVFVGKVPEDVVLNGIDCDAAVDAARIAEQEPDAGE